jgi:peptidoglycan/xylan/chitin deacetylase (PgdA/CDA1 family)
LDAGSIAGIGGAAVTVAGAAVGAWYYASLHPTSQIFGRQLIAPAKPGEIALTFDDGPNPLWTPQLLDLLAERGVRASFFLVGQYAAAQRELVRRTHAAGHLVGNHSWTHPNMAYCGVKRIREELVRTNHELEQTLGSPVRYFRAPFGARRPATLRIAHELGLIPVSWNVIGNDWNAQSAATIVERVMRLTEKNERRGSATNVVLHDGGDRSPSADRSASVAAAGELIERFGTARRFVRVDAWPFQV